MNYGLNSVIYTVDDGSHVATIVRKSDGFYRLNDSVSRRIRHLSTVEEVISRFGFVFIYEKI